MENSPFTAIDKQWEFQTAQEFGKKTYDIRGLYLHHVLYGHHGVRLVKVQRVRLVLEDP